MYSIKLYVESILLCVLGDEVFIMSKLNPCFPFPLVLCRYGFSI